MILYKFQMLDEERGKCSFDRKELSYTIYKTKQNYERYLAIQQKVAKDPILRFDPTFIHSSRKQNMMVHAKKLIRMHEHLKLDFTDKALDGIFFSEQMPLSLHFVMFLSTLKNLCTEKQAQMFLEPALRGQILGCYAQTELAHGSDIQNLITTATFNQFDETFTIDSNGIGGAKWWIGDLGIYANYAVVYAQLIIRSKKYGLHAFVVPIRDTNHNPFPGIQIGDVGPKYGFNNKDNGYALFTKYKIPLKNLLMKYVKVNSTGEYTRRGDERISYATMLGTRALIPTGCFFSLSKCVVISTRYSLVRKQFKDSKGKQIPILNYQLQQQKLVPRIAETFAIMFGSQKCNQLALDVMNEAKEHETFSRLNETHALMSGLKAIFSNDSVNGIQILRRAAGGHGFHMYSGLVGPGIQISPTPTFEGQNTILFLQTARFLLKSLKDIQKGKRVQSTVMYLEEVNNTDPFVVDAQSYIELMNPEIIRKIFLYNSCQRVKRAGLKLTELIGEGIQPKQAWDFHSGLTLVQSGIAHTYLWIYQNFYTDIYLRTTNEKVRKVLIKLLLCYGIEKILQRSQTFFESGVITSNTVKYLNEARQVLMKQLRPDLLTIVEAFGYDDNTLHSAIGCADGKAYERLIQWAQKYNVVNQEPAKSQIYEIMKNAKAQIIRPKI